MIAACHWFDGPVAQLDRALASYPSGRERGVAGSNALLAQAHPAKLKILPGPLEPYQKRSRKIPKDDSFLWFGNNKIL